jgi:hypothetical protein
LKPIQLARPLKNRRQQTEVAGVFRNLLPGAPIDHRVKRLDGQPAQKRFIVAVCLGGVDHVISPVEPMPDQRLDQAWGMLAVAVHEQHGAESGMVEPGQQRRLLSEIARQRHDLNVKRVGGQRARNGKGLVAAAVVHIDHFAGQAAGLPHSARDLAQAGMETGKPARLVVQRHHDREAALRPRRRDSAAVSRVDGCLRHDLGRESPCSVSTA